MVTLIAFTAAFAITLALLATQRRRTPPPPTPRPTIVNPHHTQQITQAFDQAIYGFHPGQPHTTPPGHYQRDAGPFRFHMPCPACHTTATHHLTTPQPGTWHTNYDTIRTCHTCDHQWGHRDTHPTDIDPYSHTLPPKPRKP